MSDFNTWTSEANDLLTNSNIGSKLIRHECKIINDNSYKDNPNLTPPAWLGIIYQGSVDVATMKSGYIPTVSDIWNLILGVFKGTQFIAILHKRTPKTVAPVPVGIRHGFDFDDGWSCINDALHFRIHLKDNVGYLGKSLSYYIRSEAVDYVIGVK